MVLLVTYQEKVVGGMVCPLLPGKELYEWYVCGLDREYRDRGIHPSVLVTWAAMDFAASAGIPRFNFMGMGRPDTPYGVRIFKARFGGRWVNHGRYVKVNRPVLYTLAEMGYNLWRFFT